MREARILKGSRSRTRRSHHYYGGRSGRADWKITMILTFGILGTGFLIVFLALHPTRLVFILSIVSFCFLVLPLLVWIPIAIRKSWKVAHEDDRELREVHTEEGYEVKDNEVEGGRYPAYNFLAQAREAPSGVGHRDIDA
ncbi:hypothetical protein R1sor_001349 [Riccia sorocarpa]|uniref:Uncharacterized protein n=1 Tax=Riccia sorocarpa TaxID=122646 RepID=A0ABD3GVQ1_9MARC